MIHKTAVISKNCSIHKNAIIGPYCIIDKNVTIAAKSGVTKNIEDNQVVAGFPAIDIKKWKKNIIKFNKKK